MLQVNFIMIAIIHKISVLLKITRILKHFLKSITDFYFFDIFILNFNFLILFFTIYNDEKFKASKDENVEEKIFKMYEIFLDLEN